MLVWLYGPYLYIVYSGSTVLPTFVVFDACVVLRSYHYIAKCGSTVLAYIIYCGSTVLRTFVVLDARVVLRSL